MVSPLFPWDLWTLPQPTTQPRVSHPAILPTPPPPGGLPSLPPTIWTVNITTYVTTVISSLDDYLSWETQFTSFLFMHLLKAMIDDLSFPGTSR